MLAVKAYDLDGGSRPGRARGARRSGDPPAPERPRARRGDQGARATRRRTRADPPSRQGRSATCPCRRPSRESSSRRRARPRAISAASHELEAGGARRAARAARRSRDRGRRRRRRGRGALGEGGAARRCSPPRRSRPRRSIGALRDDPAWRPRLEAALAEACAVAAADGVELDAARQWAMIEACPTTSTTSAARDAAAGRRDRARRDRRLRRPRRREARRPDARARRAPRGGVVPSVVALIGARARLGARPGEECPPSRGPPAARLRDRDRAAVGGLRPDRRLDRQRADRPGRAVVRRRRPVPPPGGVLDVDVPGHRVDRVDAAAARRALRPVRDRARDEPLPRAGRHPARARAAARDARGRLDPRGRAGQAASREDVGRRRGSTA